MIEYEKLRGWALSFPEATEEGHFEKPSFRVRKKIFATYDPNNQTATLKLSEKDQDLFSLPDPSIVYPVPNKWGQQGWTIVNLRDVSEQFFLETLTCAYCQVAPKNLALLLKK